MYGRVPKALLMDLQELCCRLPELCTSVGCSTAAGIVSKHMYLISSIRSVVTS